MARPSIDDMDDGDDYIGDALYDSTDHVTFSNNSSTARLTESARRPRENNDDVTEE